MDVRKEIEDAFRSYVEENELDIELSYSMPPGYEDAFGTFDITCKTLFLNDKELKSRPVYESLYYFYHEMRHAEQYLHPERFERDIQKSIPYVILYDGTCFKLADGKWLECRLTGDQDWFSLAYQSLPYELDANRYARERVKACMPEWEKQIEDLCRFWMPGEVISEEELEEVFDRIDRAVGKDRSCREREEDID